MKMRAKHDKLDQRSMNYISEKFLFISFDLIYVSNLAAVFLMVCDGYQIHLALACLVGIAIVGSTAIYSKSFALGFSASWLSGGSKKVLRPFLLLGETDRLKADEGVEV